MTRLKYNLIYWACFLLSAYISQRTFYPADDLAADLTFIAATITMLVTLAIKLSYSGRNVWLFTLLAAFLPIAPLVIGVWQGFDPIKKEGVRT